MYVSGVMSFIVGYREPSINRFVNNVTLWASASETFFMIIFVYYVSFMSISWFSESLPVPGAATGIYSSLQIYLPSLPFSAEFATSWGHGGRAWAIRSQGKYRPVAKCLAEAAALAWELFQACQADPPAGL